MPVINWNVIIAGLLYAALTGIFNFAFAHKSQIETWSLTKPRLAAFLKLTRAIGLDPWNIAASALLLFKKRLPDAQQNGAKAVAALTEAEAPPSRMFPSNLPPALVVLLLVGLAFHSQACIRGLTPKTIDQAAILLCDTFFSEQKPGVSLKDVEKAFCSTAEQIEPFLSSAKIAAQHGGAVRMQRSERP